jgi:hypothetical protein
MLYSQFAPAQNSFDSKPNAAKFYPANANISSPQQHPQPFFNPSQPQQQHQQQQQHVTMQHHQQQQPAAYFNPLQNNVNQIFNDPMASMAVKYGSSLADQGKDYVAQNVNKWFSVSQLKFYFAVDTTYVAKKLLLILFPFINRDWSIKYSNATEPVPPKLDVNAPDMYIPVMAFVTYILIMGITLGRQERFSPEELGLQASSALAYFLFEVFIVFVTLQVLSIKSALKTFDIISFCGYKYFGIILCLMGSILISKNAYYIVLVYMCVSLTYFMVRNLKLMILTSHSTASSDQSAQQHQEHQHSNPYENSVQGNKRKVYVLLFISLMQPFLMWWLTRHLIVNA